MWNVLGVRKVLLQTIISNLAILFHHLQKGCISKQHLKIFFSKSQIYTKYYIPFTSIIIVCHSLDACSSKYHVETWSQFWRRGLLGGVLVIGSDSSWRDQCPPLGVSSLSVSSPENWLLKRTWHLPHLPLSLPPLTCNLCTHQLPFAFCSKWKLPEALTKSRCWQHASCIVCRTVSQKTTFLY